MPKIVKVRNYSPPNLLDKFFVNDILPASGDNLRGLRGYNYNAGNDLRLWVRFKSDAPDELVDYDSNKIPSNAYQGTANTPAVLDDVLNSRMHQMIVGGSTSAYARITFPGLDGNNNPITFGGGSGADPDRPFSIGFWYKYRPDKNTPRTLFDKGKPGTGYEYRADLLYTGDLIFRIYGNGSITDYEEVKVENSNVIDQEWHHLVFTYDGTGGPASNAGMEIYIDGVQQTVVRDDGGSYAYMDGVSERLHIGSQASGGNIADGSIAEFAIWGKELSIEEIKAIYYSSLEDSVVKSGYISLPPRVRLRDADNRSGCYPTKHRMGDKDRSGKQNIFYEDLPIKFGSCIKDDFESVITDDLGNAPLGSGINRQKLDENKWALSRHMSIRTDKYQASDGSTVEDKCLVFAGRGTIEVGENVRFLKVKNKITNPISIDFDVIQGPYSLGNYLQVGGLDLGHVVPFGSPFSPSADNLYNGLRIQASTHPNFGSNPTVDVAFIDLEPDQRNFYGHEGTEFPVPRRKRISLDMTSFKTFEDGFYLRIAQKNFNFAIANFAISKISISYADQTINYPLLLDYNDRAGSKISNKYIANPHQSGSLTGTGRSVSGISDVANPFQEFTQAISPFNETLVIENENFGFFNTGLDPNIYPGFQSPARSKTKFTVNLSPETPTTFGHIDELGVLNQNITTDTSGAGQKLMVYWNQNLKRWEKIGQPLHHNNLRNPTLSDLNNTGSTLMLSQSCLGFGPNLASFGTRGSSGETNFYDRGLLRLSNKKTSLFNFPHGPQYNATGSQFIKASDLGITKPFLLEKCSIEFESKFEQFSSKASSNDFDQHKPFRLAVAPENTAGSAITTFGANLVTPTFFMLRQFKDNYTKQVLIKNSGWNAQRVISGSSFSIPGNYKTGQNGDSEIYVNTNRELITFGQMGLFTTSSAQSDTADRDADDSREDENGNEILISDFIDAGLSYDLNVNETLPDTNPRQLTGSFVMNFNTKYSTKTIDSVINVTQFNFNEFLGSANRSTVVMDLPNEAVRSNDDLKVSRAIVNNLNSFSGELSQALPDSTNTSNPQVVKRHAPLRDVEKISPYLILPNDNLILGWQYPPMKDPVNHSVGNDSNNKGKFSMTLFGRAKLHLYGSQVVENKEFHETVNQNLTSCAVYEHVIGGEKVIDQWQVAYRGELSGSYSRQHTYAASGYSTLHNKGISYEWWDTPQYSFLVKQTDPPSFRIGAGSYSNLDTYDGFNTSLPSILQSFIDAGQTEVGIASVLVAANQYKSCYTSINFRDQDRLFADKPGAIDVSVSAGKENIVYYYDDSSYGTTQKLGFGNVSGYSDIDRTRPVYSFNRNHFGYCSDMFQQGKDSKFKVTPRQGFTTGFDIVVNSESPVEIKFVSGTINNNPSLKEYTAKDVDAYLDEKLFQSSNLSTAATSSIPFIDDNQPRNRGYIENEYVAVALF